jgi:hypothetical protein
MFWKSEDVRVRRKEFGRDHYYVHGCVKRREVSERSQEEAGDGQWFTLTRTWGATNVVPLSPKTERSVWIDKIRVGGKCLRVCRSEKIFGDQCFCTLLD